MNIPNRNYTDTELIEFLGMQESQDIDWGNAFADQLADWAANGTTLTGDKLPWGKTHSIIRLREGEVSIWAGMNGHMKSMMLGQIMMWIAQEKRVGISSFEMSVLSTMQRMATQACGCHPSAEYVKKWAMWNEEKICYYNKLETTPSDRVLGSMFYMAKELGCKHIVIDSLTKCGLPYGERGAEKEFIDALAATAKALKIHIHLVAHVRKPHQGQQESRPTKFDVRGAGELTDLVDNVFIVWMNKRRDQIAQKVDAGMKLDPADQAYFDDNPSHELICEKQRHGAWEGRINLWFDNKSLQFTPNSQCRPLFFDIEDEPCQIAI